MFIKNTPILKFYPPGLTKKANSKIFFKVDISEEELIKDLSDLIEDNSSPVTNEKDL